ncbi:aminotransferase class I/II-fold pyridoxal phosphate-dependent enzyme [Polaromonas sp. CT11-55]|uniref:aminotransferase class I/II-fold pyridoxal phosphate-dependent enzyme n=1 Tax=Polaromonas sp. CT11-55 TaxID=3243045 RepID=UPI0039A6ECEE
MSARPSRIHGGPDGLGVPLHDFSTNSNACGPCPAALAAVQQADATRYPDAGYTALRARLAAFHGVDEARVLLAASASEFIFRVTALAAGQGVRTVWLPPLSYGDYAQAAAAHGLATVNKPGDAQLLWACEPSSPLGAAQESLSALADGRQTLLVLDRAYEPLRLSAVPTLTSRQFNTTWQLWTPNKALGLTGVRAAYAIAPLGQEGSAAALEQLCPSWPVGAHGEAMLQAWAGHKAQDWLAASLKTLREWKTRQITVCESLGWRCLPSEANFFCAQPALPQGLGLQEALAALRAQGIKLRDTTSFGLSGHVRLGVQPPAVQDALHNAWQQLRQTNS